MWRRMHRVLVRLRALVGKEFLQLLRDPRMRFVLVAPPLIELLLFGYAATFDVRHADVAVVNHDTTQASRDLLAAIRASGHYTLEVMPDMASASSAMRFTKAMVAMKLANLKRLRSSGTPGSTCHPEICDSKRSTSFAGSVVAPPSHGRHFFFPSSIVAPSWFSSRRQ